MLSHVDVFTSGKEGYQTFRLPAVETAPDGSLIALAEARKYNRSDPGFHDNDIDLVLKRSTDGGRTWSKLKVLDDPGERWSACNPATVVDRLQGRVWVLHVRTKPGRSSLTSRPGTDDATTWARYSDDNGLTWSEPTDITKATRDVENWGGSFFGPGGPIQDRKGRLIVPLSRTTGRKNAAGKFVGGSWNAFVIYSDDHGQNWHRGELLPERDWGNENQLVELADGRILMVGCAIERCTLKSAGDDCNRIVWTGPRGPGRKNLVVRTSHDEGQTFTNERLISADHAAYSDLTILKDRTVGVLWERGVKGAYEFITFSRFNLEFLSIIGCSTPSRFTDAVSSCWAAVSRCLRG